MPLRIYLTRRVLVEESGTGPYDERRLMGRQGRLAFAYLVGEHLRAVSRDELGALAGRGVYFVGKVAQRSY
jgi:hypothetical protein